ncbi:MAG: serine protease, partial [Candidatus Poribacteria bacterium]|nr:serine protease [Candidatus Poribacteria bacterium]
AVFVYVPILYILSSFRWFAKRIIKGVSREEHKNTRNPFSATRKLKISWVLIAVFSLSAWIFIELIAIETATPQERVADVQTAAEVTQEPVAVQQPVANQPVITPEPDPEPEPIATVPTKTYEQKLIDGEVTTASFIVVDAYGTTVDDNIFFENIEKVSYARSSRYYGYHDFYGDNEETGKTHLFRLYSCEGTLCSSILDPIKRSSSPADPQPEPTPEPKKKNHRKKTERPPEPVDKELSSGTLERVTRSVVKIVCTSVEGSGFVYATMEGETIVVTAKHVLYDYGRIARNCHIEKDGGVYQPKLYWTYDSNDFAHISFPENGIQLAKHQLNLGECRGKEGRYVTTFGFPKRKYRKMISKIQRSGIYFGVRSLEGFSYGYQTKDRTGYPGMSGGVAISRDDNGTPCIVGIHVAGDDDNSYIVDIRQFDF